MSPDLAEEDRAGVETLSVSIFSVHTPADPSPLPEHYARCLEAGKGFRACLLSGQAIQDEPAAACRVCRHHTLQSELDRVSAVVCALCHSPFIVS